MKSFFLTSKQALGLIGVFIFGLAAIFWAFSLAQNVGASAPSGLPSSVATSSTIQVGPQQNKTLFAANSVCAARVVTTVAQPIMIAFGEANSSSTANVYGIASTTITGAIGHLQAASTTQVYDSGLYGCGLMSAYGFNASTTISLTELR